MSRVRLRVVFGFACLAAAPLAAQTASSSMTSRPRTYGTKAVSYVAVAAADFAPKAGGSPYDTDLSGRRWGLLGPVGFFAPIRLPSGAMPVYLELQFFDTNSSASVMVTLQECEPLTGSCTNHPIAGITGCYTGFVCSGDVNAPGLGSAFADLAPDAATVNDSSNTWSLYAQTNVGDGTVKIAGVIVGYVLQVSPAPVAATFADVPTSHPYYRFIEALAKSGVTVGCGGGNFCPDHVITRQEVATWLARALGLQWN